MINRNSGETPFTFLLVEDDPAHAELVKRGFQEHRESHQIMHVSDGEAALDYLFRRGIYADEQRSPRPHVVLLDLRLPRKSGFDVLEEVKATSSLRDIPIVVLTTSQAREDAVRAYQLHANSFVVKPRWESHQIMHVSDGEAALDYLFRRGIYADEQRSPRPHVVLLDLRLPRKSGFDVLEEVKATSSLRDIPIVVLTTSQAREDAVRAYQLHANSFVVKPADFNEFSALIKETC